jgi:hypothetical protein
MASSIRKKKKKKRNTSIRYRSRMQPEPTVNFFKIKAFCCLIIVISIITMQQFNLGIGEFTSETIYNMLYYNEDIQAFNEKYLNFDGDTLKTFWNQ